VSFRSHITKLHRISESVVGNSATGPPLEPPQDVGDFGEGDNFGSMHVDENEHVSGVQKDAAVPKDSLLRSVALFYLRLESEYYVPSSTVQRIVEEIKQLTDHCKEQLKEKLLLL